MPTLFKNKKLNPAFQGLAAHELGPGEVYLKNRILHVVVVSSNQRHMLHGQHMEIVIGQEVCHRGMDGEETISLSKVGKRLAEGTRQVETATAYNHNTMTRAEARQHNILHISRALHMRAQRELLNSLLLKLVKSWE